MKYTIVTLKAMNTWRIDGKPMTDEDRRLAEIIQKKMDQIMKKALDPRP